MHKQHEQTVRGDARRDWVFMKAIVVPYTLEAQWRVRSIRGESRVASAPTTPKAQEGDADAEGLFHSSEV